MDPMHLFDRLFPLNRSLSGNGVRQTLAILEEIVPLKRIEYPTGMTCFDWTVPNEWNIKHAWVEDSSGKRLIDFKDSNLHVVGYSMPVDAVVSREVLFAHLHTLAEMPNAIPYRTSYYEEQWGFCVQHEKLPLFTDDSYRIRIDSTLQPGCITLAEGFLPGEEAKEVLFSTYTCHPSMANNELSGPIVQTLLYHQLRQRKKHRYSYRFLYAPETIGPIAYLSHHKARVKKHTIAGFVLTCIGDNASFTYKKSRIGDSLADRCALHVLQQEGLLHDVVEFSPVGSDERQYCSLGINLPMGVLGRSMYHTYKEYHTSLDNRSFISSAAMEEAVATILKIIDAIEMNDIYESTHLDCEPMLGKRGLLASLSGSRPSLSTKKIKYIMGYSDGKTELLYIAEKLSLPIYELKEELTLLVEAGLLRRC